MDEFKTSGAQNSNSGRAIGTGEGEVPLSNPLPQNVTVRTMVSDIKSMQDSGGGAPQAYTPSSDALRPSAQSTPTPQKPAVFTPPQVQTTPSASATQSASPSTFPATFSTTPSKPPSITPPLPQSKSAHSPWITRALVVVGILILVLLGYFFISPYLPEQGKTGPEALVPPRPTLPAQKPTAPPAPTPTTVPDVSTQPPASSALNSSVPYVSLFKSPLTSREVNLSVLSLASLQTALGTPTKITPSIEEVVFRNEERLVGGFNQIANYVLPAVFDDTFFNSIDAYSAFVYTDAQGVWPGYVLKAAGRVNLISFQGQFQQMFEKAPTTALTSLYLSDPGIAQTWKQGKTNEVQNRYLVFQKGEVAVSLNYGWYNDLLIISTSYDGFKEALKKVR